MVSRRGNIINVRPRELLSNKKDGHYIDREELHFVNKRTRIALKNFFEKDNIVVNTEKDSVQCFESEHYVHCHGDFMPFVAEGTIVVPDYAMSGTNYYLLTEEDVAWFEHDTGLYLL